MTTVWWLLFWFLSIFRKIFANHQKEHKDSGYETPLNSPTKIESESTSEESIELNKNEVFIDSDADEEVKIFTDILESSKLAVSQTKAFLTRKNAFKEQQVWTFIVLPYVIECCVRVKTVDSF